MDNLRPKNWAQFQHYKDRSPPWIKLHRALLDSMDYGLLSPISAKCLPLIWLIASEGDGCLPDTERLAFRLRLDRDATQQIRQELVSRGFLESVDAEHVATPAQPKSNRSRHIPDPVKVLVFQRDGGRCVWCGSVEAIEYDHVIPVSKGGKPVITNLQLLCRSCNRKKRTSTAEQAEQKQLEVLRRRSLEGETEGETELEGERERATVQQAAQRPSRFADFWQAYPNKQGKAAAEKKWRALKLDPKADEIIAHVHHMKAHDDGWQRGFIPMGSTYINGQRWTDEPKGPTTDAKREPSKQMQALNNLQEMRNGLAGGRGNGGFPAFGLLGDGSAASGRGNPGNGNGLV